MLLQLEQADASLRPWHAHVTQLALEGGDGAFARWRLTLEPWLAFLGHGQDSRVFEDASVVDIIDQVFGAWSQARLVPAWRWELADPEVYPKRSLCIQYQESDLAFVQRLMREEGLVCWFEHEAAEDDETLSSHTLVIADHNGAVQPNAQAQVRYTQSGASHDEDGLTGWQDQRRVQAATLRLASCDYRSGAQDASLRSASAQALQFPCSEPPCGRNNRLPQGAVEHQLYLRIGSQCLANTQAGLDSYRSMLNPSLDAADTSHDRLRENSWGLGGLGPATG